MENKVNNTINNLNFLDIHYHVNPDTYIRRYTAIGAGQIYKQLGGGVVLKNHLGSSVAIAETAFLEGLPVFGSIVLNKVAGTNWKKLIEHSLCLYNQTNLRLLVHLPTVVKSTHKSVLNRSVTNSYVEKYAFQVDSLLTDYGILKQEVKDLLLLAKDYPITISTGHANAQEVMKLIEASEKIGLDRLMLNQPANPMTGFTAKNLQDITKYKFVYFEQTALTVLLGYQSMTDFTEVLSNIPNVIYSSDLGQKSQIDIKQWWETSNKWFDDMNLSQSRVKEITLYNPLKLLSI